VMCTATADITVRALTVSATGISKIYDGVMAATVTVSSDKISGDTVSLAYTSASFADKNVANGKAVSVSGISISGADAGNYNLLNTTANTTANITAKHITGSFTATNKVYDGNTSATVTGRTLNGAISGDAVSLAGGTATFNNPNVGTNKPVTLTGASLSGLDAPNYVLDSVATATASILSSDATGRGFYQPVGVQNSVFVPAPNPAPLPGTVVNPVFNTIKGGQTVPLKFNVYAGSVEQTSLSAISNFTMLKLNTCSLGDATTDPVDPNFTTTGGTTLRYDGTGFIQNWQTPKVNVDTCYRATATFADGSTLSAFFLLRK